jgi:DNA-binding LacI/PurR family transcriptional regulator
VARHEFGLRVPEDLSVVGFDDAGLAGWPTFNLTTFSQPAGPMVEATVGMIIDLMARPDQPARRCIVGGKLVVRGSAKLPEGEGPWSVAGIGR